MDDMTREKRLKIALIAFGAIFFTIYPLSLIWPSGWQSLREGALLGRQCGAKVLSLIRVS